MKKEYLRNKILAALWGVGVGDALGVPVEFRSREYLRNNPVTDMTGYGTHEQPAGTFSDDSSMTYCLAESLTVSYDPENIAQNFINWYREGYWTAHGNVFDIGIATREALDRISKGETHLLAGGFEENSNGNGSLMRILPLVFYLLDKPVEQRYLFTKEISSITHMHVRSVISCFYYLEFARCLITGMEKNKAYEVLKKQVSDFLVSRHINPAEINRFDRLLKGSIFELNESDIQCSGYVLHTLEAAIWCILTTKDYKDAVLKAVNLGDDTDTTAAVTGGLAGLIYGCDGIPPQWVSKLARFKDIENLAERLAFSLTLEKNKP